MGIELAIISLVISAGVAIYAATLDISTDQDDVGVNVTREGTSNTKNVIYGECRTGATRVYSNVNNHDSEELLQVFSFGLGVTAVRNIYIDDVQVIGTFGDYRETSTGGTGQLLWSNGSGLINGFENQVSLQIRAGLETGVPMSLAVGNSDGEWTNAFRGDDVSACAVLARRVVEDGVRITSDQINVSALVKGVPVYDMRYNATGEKQYEHDTSVPIAYRQCGRNPSLALYDFLTSTAYGIGIDTKYINEASFGATATWCDDNEFRIDGEVNLGDSFGTSLQNIMDCAGLALTIENGEIHCHFEDVAVPVQHFDHDNILKGTLNVEETSSSTYFNLIEVEYKNSSLDDKQDTYTIPTDSYNDPQIMADGQIISSTLSMPLVRYNGDNVNNPSSPIYKLANRQLAKAQFQRQISFDIDLAEYPVQIFDVITVTDENLGWDTKEFRINNISKSISSDQGISIATIKGSEYDDSIYTGTKNGGGGSEPLPKPPAVTPVAGMVFDQTDYITEGYGTLSWSRTFFASDVEYIVDFKTDSASAWTRLGRTSATEWEVARLPADTYDFRVFTLSNQYGSSVATVLEDQVVSGLGVLPEVTGATVDATGLDFEYTWDDMLEQPVDRSANPDAIQRVVGDIFSHYRVSLFDSADVLLSTVQAATNEYIYTFSQNTTEGTNRVVKATIEIVALDGTASQIGTGSEVTATNNQVAVPTGLVSNQSLSNTIVTWDDPTATDYRTTLILHNTVSIPDANNPPADTVIEEAVGTLWSKVWDDDILRYVRVAHVDRFGNDSLNASAEFTAQAIPIDDLLPVLGEDLAKLRSPYNDEDERIQRPEFVEKAVDGDLVTSIGMISDEATGRSDLFLVADNVYMAAGGHDTWDNTTTYSQGDRVFWYLNPLASFTLTPQKSGSGNFWGYNSGSYGNIDPNDVQGYVIDDFYENDSGTCFFEFTVAPPAGTPIPNTVLVTIALADDISTREVFEFERNTDSWFRLSSDGGINRWFRNNVDTPLSITFVDPSASLVDNDTYIPAALFESLTNNNTGNEPSSADPTNWSILNENVDQVAFYTDAATGITYLRGLVVDELNGNQITAHSITANEIEADTITGNEINSTTTIIAGSGATTAAMNGDDSGNVTSNRNKDVRFWAGSEYARNPDGTLGAPFLVDNTGTVQVGNTTGYTAQIVGDVNVATEPLITVTDGTNPKLNIYPDGKFTMGSNASQTDYTNDEIMVAIDPINETSVFKGTIYAEEIVGDLVSAKRVSGRGGLPYGWSTYATLSVSNNTGDAATVTISGGVCWCTYTGNLGNNYVRWDATLGWRLLRNGTQVDGFSIRQAQQSPGQSYTQRRGFNLPCPVLTDSIPAGDTATRTYQLQTYWATHDTNLSAGGASTGSVVGQLFRDGGAWL